MKIRVYKGSASLDVNAKELGNHKLTIRVRDVDDDGDLDAELLVNGVVVGTMEVARLAKNVRNEVLRAVARFREWRASKKKGKSS